MVSVIVVTWNSEHELPGCLGALASDGHSVPLEIICVDNGSDDRSAELALAAGGRVIANATNLGFPRAVNRALALAGAPYVLLLNPDVRVDPGAIASCVDVLAREPDVGLVGCNLRRPDGSPDRAAARRWRSVSAIAVESLGLTRLSRRLDFQYFPSWSRRDSRDVPCIHGAFALMRTAELRDLGGLDESAFMYLEDLELCRRVASGGKRIRFVAEAGGVHDVSAVTRRADPERQAIAYLHRLDADVEFIRRTRGRVARLAALGLLALRSVSGLVVAIIRRQPDRRGLYAGALRWLARQRRGRVPPPPVS